MGPGGIQGRAEHAGGGEGRLDDVLGGGVDAVGPVDGGAQGRGVVSGAGPVGTGKREKDVVVADAGCLGAQLADFAAAGFGLVSVGSGSGAGGRGVTVRPARGGLGERLRGGEDGCGLGGIQAVEVIGAPARLVGAVGPPVGEALEQGVRVTLGDLSRGLRLLRGRVRGFGEVARLRRVFSASVSAAATGS